MGVDDDHDRDSFFNFYPRSDDDRSGFNKKILLVSIISLSIVIVIVIVLHLYARYVLRRQYQRRAAIHQLSLTVAQSREPTPNTGLDPSLIATLPTFVFKPKGPHQQQQELQQFINHDDASVLECSVCLSVLENEERVRLLPNCKHVFHVGCIDTWLASHSTCPICRTKAEPRLEPQPRESPVVLGLDGASVPTAPLLLEEPIEGTSDGTLKINGSISRLSSFRRMLSRERSSRRIQPSSHDDVEQDLERQ